MLILKAKIQQILLGTAICIAGVSGASAYELDKRQPASGQTPQVQSDERPKKKAESSGLIYTYLFDPRKYNDLTIRAQNLHIHQETRPQVFNADKSAAYQALFREYARRIYQGYSADKASSARIESHSAVREREYENPDDRLSASLKKALTVGSNMLASYQPIRLGDSVEGRLAYDVVGNSARCGVAYESLLAEVRYFAFGSPSTAIPREYFPSANESVDQYGSIDSLNLSVTQRIDELGVAGKIRYGMNTRIVSYGASKTLAGPLVGHVIRENSVAGARRNNTMLLVSLGMSF